MYSLNKAQLIGNLTRDPELRQTNSGQTVATIGVATNRSWTDSAGQKQEATEFHNVVVWGKLAEICGQYLKKGNKVFFEGRLQTRSWEGQDGNKRYSTEIVASDMIMLSPKGSGGEVGGPIGADAPQDTPPADQAAEEVFGGDDKGDDKKIDINDLPF